MGLMPGRLAKVAGAKGMPPEKGSAAWKVLVATIAGGVHNKQPFCGLSGGRRSDGWPCESRWTKVNGLCRFHGGSAPRGAEHHAFIHGRSARVYRGLPKRFHDAYMASIEDTDLLSLRVDLAMSDARVEELVARLDTGETGERWQRLRVVAQELRKELVKEEPDSEALLDEIEELAQAAASEERSWRELREASQHRRKLVDTERRRLKDLHAYLTAEEALALVARLTDSIVRHVEDKAALTAILEEVQTLTGHDPGDRKRLTAI